jgi:hypothetical protein
VLYCPGEPAMFEAAAAALLALALYEVNRELRLHEPVSGNTYRKNSDGSQYKIVGKKGNKFACIVPKQVPTLGLLKRNWPKNILTQPTSLRKEELKKTRMNGVTCSSISMVESMN